ncbi:serine/threonine-protein kinase [Nocardia jinanensis]|uniref:serine/threonine-protein kinase n=1 Tax=Nocardia jinanensis TaxID=382504 RepID=UPI001F3E23AE|nr:serine/threonine-protein kinase [Nocardia jinanensis]
MEGTEFGRYRLLDPLGAGAMGEVHRAYDTGTERMVAVKVLSKEFAQDKTYRRRFQREAQLVARLHEPHIVPIHDFGEIDGRLFLEMRLVEAPNLATLLADQGPLDTAEAVAVITQIAAALDAAHTSGVVHRDVKPSNILVTPDGFAYLIDFGIARSGQDTTLTRAGTMIGTLAYMAPERLTLDQIDARSDVYSLACVLYECLAGTKPYRGDSVERQIAAHLTDRPPLPSAAGVPPAFDAVIAQGMAKDPDERYRSAGELAAAAKQALLPAAAPAAATPPDTAIRAAVGPATDTPTAVPPAATVTPATATPAAVTPATATPAAVTPRTDTPPDDRPLALTPPTGTPSGDTPRPLIPPAVTVPATPPVLRGKRTAAAVAALLIAVVSVSALALTREGAVVTDAPETTAPPAVSVTVAPGAPAADTSPAPGPRLPEEQHAPSVTHPAPAVPSAPPAVPGSAVAENVPTPPAGDPVDQPRPAPELPLPTTSVAAPSTSTTTPTTTETTPTTTTDPGTTTPSTTPSGGTATTTPPETTGTGEQTGSVAGSATTEKADGQGGAIATPSAHIPSSDPIASSAPGSPAGPVSTSATAPTHKPTSSSVPAPAHAPTASSVPASPPASTPSAAAPTSGPAGIGR